MVFANLSEDDKAAFFALLDEYFASRPELAHALGIDPSSGAAAEPSHAAVSAVAQRAFGAAPKVAAAYGGPKATPFAAAASNPDIANAVGRVAAASRTFGSPAQSPSPNLNKPASGAASDTRPPPPPRRNASSSSNEGPSGNLITQRKLGDLDTSSGKNMLWGMRKKEAAAPPAPVPSALPKPGGFAPPPVRRAGAPPPVVRRAPTPEPESEPEPEPEPQGEWAEALYDYKSTDPNDLPLRENQRVLVTAHTSDDWWTGEVDGKSGLFPATYVKLL